MRALRFDRFGKPDVLRVEEVSTPAVTPGSALVRVAAASINPSDVKNVQGVMEGTVLPRTPGRDFSGTVLDGPAEWIGAEVWGTGGDVGFTVDGSHAEMILVPAAALVRKPRALSHEQAGSIGVNFVVAWLGAVEYGRLTAEDTVAVIGAGGGVGGAAAQIARSFGARVIGLGRGPLPPDAPAAAALDRFVPLGPGAVQAVRDLTGGRGATLVYDTVGGMMFETALHLAAPRGRVVQISAASQVRVEFDLRDFYHNETVLIGADSRKLDVAASARIMASLVDGFEAGRLKPPVIAGRFPLANGRAAYEAVGHGTAGRVVITP